MKKLMFVLAGLIICISGAVQAWQPNGWVWSQWPYMYSADSGWHYADAGSDMWCYNYQNRDWKRLGKDGVTAGWSYFQWPHVYSPERGWMFCSQGDLKTLWCYSFSGNFWSQFGTQTIVFQEDFSGPISPSRWHIPTWSSPNDGTYIGRTQLRCVGPGVTLPLVSGGAAYVALNTYNPTGPSFYGTDLIGNQTYTASQRLTFTIRAKLVGTCPGGIVGGIFLYGPPAAGDGSLHDEIDFELVSNHPNRIQTNIYGHEPLGAGHSAQHTFVSGTLSDYHTYQIVWLPGKVIWSVDGIVIRTVTTKSPVPTGPMSLHLNIWAVGSEWAYAYNPALSWTTNPSHDQAWYLIVDSVTISR
jgi:hypothetical protein